MTDIYSTQRYGHNKQLTGRFTFVPSYMRVTREYAAVVFGKDSRLIDEVHSVPGGDRKLAGSGYCAAGKSTPASWQTLAPPKID